MFILVTLLNMNDKWAKILVQVIVIVANYFLSKLFVFNAKKREDTQINLKSFNKVQYPGGL